MRKDAPVPIVTEDEYQNIDSILQELRKNVVKKDYHPKKLIGFLGYCKKQGATRFTPVMSIEDFSVFYACVSLIEEQISFDDIKGVYGGWRMRKNPPPIQEEWGFGEYVHDSSLSKENWIKNWKNYSELLSDECDAASEETFFHCSDVANFYDSIDLDMLESKIKSTLNQWDESIDLLFHFLKYWNRTIKGYQPSSRGLPQEFVNDASRLLANFYLRSSDLYIKKICDENNIKFIRWSDDVVFIGANRKELEGVVYLYSKYLLRMGLNLRGYPLGISMQEYGFMLSSCQKRFYCVLNFFSI